MTGRKTRARATARRTNTARATATSTTTANQRREAARAFRRFRREQDKWLDRYMARWLRGLLLVTDGKVEKLSEKEVQELLLSSRPAKRRKSKAKKPAGTRSARKQR